MTKEEIRKLIKELIKDWDVVVSIPMVAGCMGDIETISYFPAIQDKMKANDNPLRMTGPAYGGGLKAYVFGETSKMKANPEYIEKFVTMAQQVGEVQDILGMRY